MVLEKIRYIHNDWLIDRVALVVSCRDRQRERDGDLEMHHLNGAKFGT